MENDFQLPKLIHVSHSWQEILEKQSKQCSLQRGFFLSFFLSFGSVLSFGFVFQTAFKLWQKSTIVNPVLKKTKL